MSLVAVEDLNRHRSIINRVLSPLSYTATVVDPTGLKPAPHGLKGRRSVTRAPGQQHFQLAIFDCRLASSVRRINREEDGQLEIGNRKSAMIWLWRKDSNLRMAAVTVRCLTDLATPQENWLWRRDSNSHTLVYKTSALLSN